MKAVYVIALIALLVAAVAATDIATYAKIAAVVNKDPSSTWQAGISEHLMNMDFTTIKNLMGDLSVTGANSSNQLEEKKCGWSVSASDLPTEFFSADKWTKCSNIKTVHDQSACGSCWAVSTGAAAAERYCIATGEDTYLSTRDITSCCTDCGYGCNGGWPSAAWSYVKSHGIPTGSPDSTNTSLCVRYPFLSCKHHVDGTPQCSDYDFDTPKCQRSCDSDSTYSKDYNTDLRKAKTSFSVYGEENMMKEIYENGPITLSYSVYQDFMTYTGGVYSHKTGSSLGGHAVVVSGWGVTAEGVKYWVVKNNWNNSWGINAKTGQRDPNGDNGYFWILRGKNECGCESGSAAATF